jgi:hypothetical protein
LMCSWRSLPSSVRCNSSTVSLLATTYASPPSCEMLNATFLTFSQPFNAFLAGFGSTVGQFVLTSKSLPSVELPRPPADSLSSLPAHPNHRSQQVRIPVRFTRASLCRLRRVQSHPALLLRQLHQLDKCEQRKAEQENEWFEVEGHDTCATGRAPARCTSQRRSSRVSFHSALQLCSLSRSKEKTG